MCADEIIKLGEEDSRIFADALINYREPNDALRVAVKDYLERYVDSNPDLKSNPRLLACRAKRHNNDNLWLL